MLSEAYNLFQEAACHTEPSAALDAAWTWHAEQDDPCQAFAFDTETTGALWGAPQICLMHPDTISPVIVRSEKSPIVFGISGCFLGPEGLHLLWGRIGSPMFAWIVDRLAVVGPKVAHNLRFDLRVCRDQDIPIGDGADCTLTMARIVWDRKKKFDLQTLAEMLCPEVSDWCSPVKQELTRLKREYKKAKIGREPNYSDVPDEIMGQYSMIDSFLCWLLNVRLCPEIDADFAELYARERAIIDLIADVEDQGIPFDWRQAKREMLALRPVLRAAYAGMEGVLGHSFNPNSPPQKLAALKALKAPMKRLRKKGAYTTDAKVLLRMMEVYRDEVPEAAATFIEHLFEYSAVSKILSTYLRPLAARAKQASGMIYCSVNPTNTRTGRMSSSGPNFQNIPRAKSLDQPGYSVKRCVKAPPGWRFWYFDYDAMEFAVFGLLAGEQSILVAYAAGEDLHLAMSKRLFGEEKATEMRQLVKAIDFAIIYGAGNNTIAEQLSIGVDEATAHREMYYEQFPAIPEFMKRCKVEIRRQGYVQDLFGRRYHLPRGQEYKAPNALVQGGCAQAFKIGQTNMPVRIRRGPNCVLMLPVHDENQFRRKHTEYIKDRLFVRQVIRCMIEIPQFTSRGFRLRVTPAYSDTTWAEKQKWVDE